MCGRETQGATDPSCEARRSFVEERCPQCDCPITDAARDAVRCDTCGLRAFSSVTTKPRTLAREADVHASLEEWADSESMSVEEFLETSFGEESVASIHARLVAGEVVGTSFDILGFLFSHLGGGQSGGGGGSPDVAVNLEEPEPDSAREPPTQKVSLPDSPVLQRRSKILPLVSVMAADGRLLPEERRIVDQFLMDEGLGPLEEHEIRVHRPQEVGSVGTADEHDRLLSLMFELAYIDKEGDSSELNVIRAFAHRWGVHAERLAELERLHQPMGWDRFVFRMKSILLG